mgnify:CR=1 FL=1
MAKKTDNKKGYEGTLAEYKKARFNFEVLETMEAGIELTGNETKAVRLGQVTFDGSHIGVRGNEVFLIGAHISPYQPSQSKDSKAELDPDRSRKLLLRKEQIIQLADAEAVGRQTIVPLAFLARGRYIKLVVGIVRGKKQADKRQTLKRRDDKREMDRTLKFQ